MGQKLKIRMAVLLLGIGVLLFLGLGLWVFADGYLRTARVVETQRISGDITAKGFRLALLTSEFLLHKEIRARRQWRKMHADLQRTLAEERLLLAPFRVQVTAIGNSLDEMGRLFDTVLATIDRVTGADRHPAEDEIYRLQTSQLIIRVAELQSAIDGMESVSRRSVQQVLGTSNQGLLFKLAGLFALGVLFGAGAWWFFYNRIQRPLTVLQADIERIRGGAETLRAGKCAEDELGAVVDAFNALLDQQQVNQRRLTEMHDRLQMSNKELQDFAYVVSHDLQEPLRMVSSYMALLERRYIDSLDQDATDFIAFAVDGANRMSAMIEGLLQYSRVETQGDPFQEIELRHALDGALDNLQLRIEETGADIDSQPLPRVNADASQMERLLQNLIGNAIKFHGDAAPEIRIEVADDGECWRISVRDNGIGMKEEDAQRVFKMFQRLHTRDEYPGMGVGLAVCRRIVKRHGGRIWVESRLGEGARFTFTLPKAGNEQ